MKRILLGLLLAAVVSIAACPMALAADSGYSSWSASELPREAYISVLAEEKGISYETAEALDETQNQAIVRTPDQVVRYATLEKKVETISNGNG